MIAVDRPDERTEYELVRSLENLYIEAKQYKNTMRAEWLRHYRLTNNRASAVVAAAAGVRANEVYATIDARVAWMTDQEILCSVTPACDPFSLYSMTTETLGDQLEQVINSLYRTNHWYAEVVKMLWDANVYGTGFLKAVWDSGLTWGEGQVDLKSVSPWCLYVDPYATNLTDAEYIVEVHTMTAAEIERRFPGVSPELIGEVVSTGDQGSDHLTPNQKGIGQKQAVVGLRGELIPINAGQGPTTWGGAGGAKLHTTNNFGVNVYEFWFRENYSMERESTDPEQPSPEPVVYDQWRVVVYAGGRVLLDELAENLFESNRHPYVRFVDVDQGEFWGSALLRDIGPPQVSMNRLLAMAQNNIEFTGNPIFVGVKGSGVDRSTFLNKPGQIYDVNQGPNASSQRPDWLSPPQLPASILQFIQLWRDEIERISGLQGAQKGEVPSGRATDKQVSATQEAGFVRIRSAQRQLELTMRRAFELVANLIVVNYDTPRFVAIVGTEGETTSIRLAAQHFYSPGPDGRSPMRYTLTVNAGSAKPTSRAARIQEAIQLKAMNVVDDQYVLQAFQVSHWQQVLQRKQAQMQAEATVAALVGGGKGEPHGPGQGHPH